MKQIVFPKGMEHDSMPLNRPWSKIGTFRGPKLLLWCVLCVIISIMLIPFYVMLGLL